MKTQRRKQFKALTLCLALLMAISLFSTTVFAIGQDEKGTITVSGVEAGVTVSAYRLMDVAYDYTANQPVEPVYTWTNEVANWVRTNYSSYIGVGTDNSVQKAFSTASTNDIAAFYDKLAAAIKDGNSQVSLNVAGTCTGSGDITGLTMGNYLILIENGMRVYRPSAVNFVPTWDVENSVWEMSSPAVVEVKSSTLTIDKTVNDKEADNANIGDTVTFEIVADVPQFPANATAKNYAISDTLSDGLTFNSNSLKVYGITADDHETELVNGTTTYYVQSNQRPNSGGTSTFTLTFNYAEISDYQKIRVEYTATLNENVVLGESGNINNAVLDYSNNPYDSSSWESQTDKVTVYTYGLDISKVDKDDNHSLSGAEFELYASENDATSRNNKISFVQISEGVYRKALANEEGNTTLVVGSGQNGSELGKLTLKGLDEGTWYLLETKAPDSYNKLAAPIVVTITDIDNGVLDGKVTNAKGTNGEDVALVSLKVENDDGFQLPVTGGMGTVLFTAIGIVLMGAAIALLVIIFRKRKAER